MTIRYDTIVKAVLTCDCDACQDTPVAISVVDIGNRQARDKAREKGWVIKQAQKVSWVPGTCVISNLEDIELCYAPGHAEKRGEEL